MARLAKTTQAALDELDRSYAPGAIEGRFMPTARAALDGLHGRVPEKCLASIERVVTELAKNAGELPTGYGSTCIRHFNKRSEQIGSVLNAFSTSIENRFALIELATLACIAGRWMDPPKLWVTRDSHKACLRDVAQSAVTSYIERERWRALIGFLLDSPSAGATSILVRNVACALAWCGCFSPVKSVTDEQLAQQFRTDRAAFVRDRLEALRWLFTFLEFSAWRPAEGHAT